MTTTILIGSCNAVTVAYILELGVHASDLSRPVGMAYYELSRPCLLAFVSALSDPVLIPSACYLGHRLEVGVCVHLLRP